MQQGAVIDPPQAFLCYEGGEEASRAGRQELQVKVTFPLFSTFLPHEWTVCPLSNGDRTHAPVTRFPSSDDGAFMLHDVSHDILSSVSLAADESVIHISSLLSSLRLQIWRLCCTCPSLASPAPCIQIVLKPPAFSYSSLPLSLVLHKPLRLYKHELEQTTPYVQRGLHCTFSSQLYFSWSCISLNFSFPKLLLQVTAKPKSIYIFLQLIHMKYLGGIKEHTSALK